MVRIKLRYKDLNAKGNGEQTTRRLRLPDGTRGWASDIATDVQGAWSSGTFLASDRRASQSGLVPPGTIVVDFESPFRGGRKSGSATIRAAVVLAEPNEGSHLHWGLSTRKRGDEYQVQTPEGDWVEV